MLFYISGRLRPSLAAILLVLSVSAGPACAARGAAVPDLLDLPARADARAHGALQLAVARAGERLVAVGVYGAVLLSDDAGKSWRQAAGVPVSVALTDVSFASAERGWAVGHGGVVLHSADAGEHWARQLDGRDTARIVLDAARARLAAGDPAAAREVRDAERLVEEGPDKPLLGVSFVDAQRGYVVGAYGLALMTEDGGQRWQSLVGRIPNPRGKHLYQIRAVGREILIAGEQGALFRSVDGGETFAEVPTPYAGTFFGALALDGDTLLAYGLRGNVWRSGDGGQSWSQVDTGQAVTISSGLRLADGSLVLADESGRLLRSTDAGRSFGALSAHAAAGSAGLVQAADGALILSGARGLVRVEPAQLASEPAR